MTALIISNKGIDYIMEIVKCLKESGLLIKAVCETIKNEAKNQKGRFLGMLLETVTTSLFGDMLAAKPEIPGREIIKASERTIRAGQDF